MRVLVPASVVWVCNAYYTLNLCHSSWDRRTTSLSSSNLTGCYRALWPLGARLIYMLPVREILGRANCFAQRETAITALKCEHLRVCVCEWVCAKAHFIFCNGQDKLFVFMPGGNLNVHMDFIYWCLCFVLFSEHWRFSWSSCAWSCSYRSTSRWVSQARPGSHQLSVELCSKGCPALLYQQRNARSL